MKLIIITGSPGCGKTTLSKRLTNLLNCISISLNELVVSKKFIIDYEERRDTYIIDFDKLENYLFNYIEETKKKDIEYLIIEGHFADFLPNNLIDFVIILRCHPDVLLERLERRNYKREKILENIQAEILGNCSNYIVQKELSCPIFEFNTSEMDLEALIHLILRFLEGKEDLHKYFIGNIDWLNELFETDRLNEFF